MCGNVHLELVFLTIFCTNVTTSYKAGVPELWNEALRWATYFFLCVCVMVDVATSIKAAVLERYLWNINFGLFLP